MSSHSLTDLSVGQDGPMDEPSFLKETKSLTDLTLNKSSTNFEIDSTTEDKYFQLELASKMAEMDTELLQLVIANLESTLSAINSERLELESQLESTNTCISALESALNSCLDD